MSWKKILNAERPRKSTSKSDHRTQFERDYDRAIFSTPVKRLQAKAQVFPLERHDAVRTRLTHSLEVSSIARGLAIAISKWLVEERKEIDISKAREIETIASTCGLLHDLGNPPFGHAGELAIREWFEKQNKDDDDPLRQLKNNQQLVNDFLKFDGNAQTLRLVAKLQILADHNGLNLTYGTLSALCKYTASSNETDKDNNNHAKSKPGYFASENELIKLIRDKTGTGDFRNPITYLVEAADDIVYSIADVEDAIKKSIFTWEWFEEKMKEFDMEMTSSSSAPDITLIKRALNSKDSILKAGESELPKHLPGDVHASAYRTAVIGILVPAAFDTFKQQYDKIMSGQYKGELVSNGSATPLIKMLKEIGLQYVYSTESTLKLELMGRKIIMDLLDLFNEGVKELSSDKKIVAKGFQGKIGALLSENYRRVFYNSVEKMPEIPECYHRYRLLTDYICGMTDSFAQRLHADLTNA